ncbi:uncharacterized protein LOC104895392 [Beta vulgaris subsp. vulgaris]|uniref:uncharacterized protein LOC104895392 n=1 Tax=Beta vulgaris subsp. vulgaris TaxID=3555 RepID=UPI002036D04A|nr:uncharacterized protein LOC104895392 [Beta vulgaris subsp. vulgaris]
MTHLAPIFRTESGTWFQTIGELQTNNTITITTTTNNNNNNNYNNNYLEKRQLFLRSYQFSRKQSFGERIKTSLVRVKRLIMVRVRSVRRLRKLVWPGLRFAIYNKRRRLFKLLNQYYYFNNNSNNTKNSSSFKNEFKYELFHRSNINSTSCFW